MSRILLVDDNGDIRFMLRKILEAEGYTVESACTGKEALRRMIREAPDLVLLDMRLPDSDGIEILKKIRERDPDAAVIMLTAYGEVRSAVQAMKAGAFDYITKPFETEELLLVISRALQAGSLHREVARLRQELGDREVLHEVMGESDQIRHVLKQVEIVAPTPMTVILYGESGVGKELVAKLIHQRSRRPGPLVAIDSGAIPDTLVESELFGYEKGAFSGAEARKTGKFEQAHRGTLFLDEIANLPAPAQAKLLRAIQEKQIQHLGGVRPIPVDVRLLAASNADLPDAVKAGRFRDDLYHRLNEFQIVLPPLRERKTDIPILAKQFLEDANRELGRSVAGFTDEAMRILIEHSWPGNVRELKNAVKKAVLVAEGAYLHPAHLAFAARRAQPGASSPGDPEGSSLKKRMKKAANQIEENMIRQALSQSNGNKSKAAKLLNITRTTLYAKMRDLGLSK